MNRGFLDALMAGEGSCCPHCDQRAQVYSRSVSGAVSHGLMLLYGHSLRHPREYVHIASFFSERKAVRGNDGALLRHWLLIEPRDTRVVTSSYTDAQTVGTDPHGMYRITEFGRQFVLGDVEIPKFIYTYNEEVIARSDEASGALEEWVDIRSCLGKKFDWDEVMASPDLRLLRAVS